MSVELVERFVRGSKNLKQMFEEVEIVTNLIKGWSHPYLHNSPGVYTFQGPEGYWTLAMGVGDKAKESLKYERRSNWGRPLFDSSERPRFIDMDAQELHEALPFLMTGVEEKFPHIIHEACGYVLRAAPVPIHQSSPVPEKAGKLKRILEILAE